MVRDSPANLLESTGSEAAFDRPVASHLTYLMRFVFCGPQRGASAEQVQIPYLYNSSNFFSRSTQIKCRERFAREDTTPLAGVTTQANG